MAKECYWSRRLADTILKAEAASNPRLRDVYRELAAHYRAMLLVSARPSSERRVECTQREGKLLNQQSRAK